MAIRTVCFVGAIVVGPGWLRWVLVVAALLLPYVAVVMANAVAAKSDGFALTTARRTVPGAAGQARIPTAPRGSDAFDDPLSPCKNRRAN